ncbi:MAG TPA: hypothetical protein VFI31_08260, partial [Pirellulales bacterium]|nr:hypothetical protein [Pirellulales bacterium]
LAVAISQGQPKKSPRTTQELKDSSSAGSRLALFATLFEKRLQKPLREDDAREAAAKAALQAGQQKASPLAAVLVGTMIEDDGFSRAMFSVPPANIELKAVGDTVGVPPVTAEVVEIDRSQVVVRYQGQLLTLRLKGADEG